ncbi:MAG: phosphoribosylformylglycinamidine cyclo-ligase [Acidimicrobiia bacterium]|nr:phosphoribosylformylglycinamidine cyclo-ligase [Acidimicrobiia bacterium]
MQAAATRPADAYRAAGVDIDAGNRAVALLSQSVASTGTPHVLSAPGGFGGMYSAAGLGADAVLVASTDGVGTKAALAGRYGRWRGIGVDLVNHCIGDIAVHGARPLFFLDYIAMATLEPEVVAEVVAGVADACRTAGCALLGGETAEMPGTYVPGAVDVVGTIVGAAPRDRLLPRPESIRPGDALVGLASSGPHTNGYSLIRHLLDGRPGAAADTGLIDALLEPHRSYLPAVTGFSEAGIRPKALAHITGGGILDNLPRVLPAHLGARVDLGAWPVPQLFATLVDWSGLDDSEAFRVWNMGIGLVAVVEGSDADALAGHGSSVIGAVIDIADAGGRITLEGSWR